MGKVDKTLLNLHGDLYGICFYVRDGKMYSRKKSNLNKERVQKDPAFAKSRESSNEFGNVSKFTKIIFDATSPLTKGARDSRAFFRLMKVMGKIKEMDMISASGQRNPMIGIADPNAKKLLGEFSFVVGVNLNLVLFRSFVVDRQGGVVLNNFDPKIELLPANNSTHYKFVAIRVDIDPTTAEYSLSWSNEFNGCLKDSPKDVELSFENPATNDKICIYMIKLSFLEMYNGELLSLQGKRAQVCGFVSGN